MKTRTYPSCPFLRRPFNPAGVGSKLPFDTTLRTLVARERRRLFVYFLKQDPQAINVRDIIRELQTGENDRERLRTRMYHIHRPRLKDIGAIEWNRKRNRVSRGQEFERITDVLQQLDDVIGNDTS